MDDGFKVLIGMSVLRWSLACVVAIYILMIVGLAVFQRRLQYFPDRHLADPAQAGMSGVEDLRLTTDDGETLVAWYVPAKDGHPLILYFHGNGGALVDRVPRFRALMASGYGLLALSYRGYGGSTGSPTQKGLMEDAETAYLEARARGYNGDRIVLIGESLGTGVAIALAATHEAAALVLEFALFVGGGGCRGALSDLSGDLVDVRSVSLGPRDRRRAYSDPRPARR